MRFSSYFSNFFLTISLIGFTSCIFAMGGRRDRDPLMNMKYRTAFDQTKIHQDFADCMKEWGCDRNVFGAAATAQGPRRVIMDVAYQSGYQPQGAGMRECLIPVEHEFMVVREGRPVVSRAQAYQDACLKKLLWARRYAISAPIQDFGSMAVVLGCCALTLQKMLEGNKEASVQQAVGFGWMNFLYNLGFRLEDAIRAGINLYWPPEERLGELEERFAKNKCFIPRQLWEKIVEEFMMARTNQISQDAHINNLEFAVDLTIYKPLKPLVIAQNKSLQEAKQEICARIENFMKSNYRVPQDCLTQEIVDIQEAVCDFLDALAQNTRVNNPVKPLFLKGSYGIGKSFFVIDNLYKWIEEFFPGSVKLEQLQHLTSAAELQGSVGHEHGMVLDIVRNQCKVESRGSIVFVDEGTWLNNPSMVDISKVVFNGYQSHVSTKYFGDDVAIDIPVPPMLIVVASNEPIKDKPLESRFKQIEFPMPTVKALVDYALDKAQQSDSLRLQGIAVTRQDVQDFINPSPLRCLTQKEKAVDNFRDADKIVTHLLGSVEFLK